MKAWKEPQQKTWGMDYSVGLTDEFEKIIDAAIEKIEPFSHKEVSRLTTYFKVKGEEVCSHHDTCDNQKCINAAKRAIREDYGKGTHIEECWTDNDGDHENIEICSVCEKPLNESLTWCESELQYIEGETCNAEFFKHQAFLIHAILNSTPTQGCKIDNYAKHQEGKILEKALQRREDFFQRILKLAESVISAFKNDAEIDILEPEVIEYGYFKFEVKNKIKCRGESSRNLSLTLKGKRSVIAKRIKIFE